VSELALAPHGAPADGGQIAGVGERPTVKAKAEVVCPPGAVLGALLGDAGAEVEFGGDRRVLEIVRAALTRA
jgi:hypothetical protein